MKNCQHLVVISIDGLQASDSTILQSLSNFRSLLDCGSYAKEVIGVYPSLTYPSHASIITGTYPKTHGIYDNIFLKVGAEYKRSPWYWFDKYYKVPTLYHAVKNAGLTVGSIFWPVTAGAPIDYNCPPIWTHKPLQNQIYLSLRYGSPLFLLELKNRFSNLLKKGYQYPQFDEFAVQSTAYMIKKYKPNLVLLNLSELDHVRHQYGVYSDKIEMTLERMDQYLGTILQAVKAANTFSKTTFVILGDHGFADITYKIAPNVLFEKEGWISLDSSGKIKKWQVYAHSGGGFAQIYFKDANNIQLKEKVKKLLENLRMNPMNGIAALYTKEEALKRGAAGEFEWMIEPRKGFGVTEECQGEYLQRIQPSCFPCNDKIELATHGYNPMRSDYRTFFLVSGAGVQAGTVLDSMKMIDQAPTMAALLGLQMPSAEGKIIYEFLSQEMDVRMYA